jgi:hypothetical protein
VAILTGAPILGADHPKIGDLLAGSHNAFRTQLPEVVRELMESSTRWIKLISTIRNLLTHRDHEKLIFGPPTERRQFQVYEGALLPKILEPFLLVDTSSNIVDLDRYLAFVWAEMNVLMDKLGSVVACHLGVQVVLTARRETTSTFLLTDLDAMIGS